MKLSERINCILLGTLWILAIVLVLDFWLNTVYNFNIFSQEHWQYVANLQASKKTIATGFYIAITLAISVGIFGLYMLFRPKFRKIILTTPNKPEPQDTNNQKTTNTDEQTDIKPVSVSQPILQRPPHLHIQLPKRTQKTVQQQPQPQKTTSILEPKYIPEIQKIFEENGYRVLTPKTIARVPLSLVALGTKETLWLGACNISHEQMMNLMMEFKSIFQETLEDIEIDINSFIINPTDDESTDVILDLKSLQDLSIAISATPNEPESDADRESGNMAAFSGYIETVLTYLEKKQ